MVKEKEVLNSLEEIQTRQLKHLWEETRIGDILPWDELEEEAETLLESPRANRQASDDSRAGKEEEDDPAVDRDETDPYNEAIFGRKAT